MNLIGKMAYGWSDKIVGFAGGDEELKMTFGFILKRMLTQIMIMVALMMAVYPFGLSKIMFVYYTVSTIFRACYSGWHSKNDTICLIISIMLPITAVFITTLIDFPILIIIVIYILAAIIGIKLGTYVHPNRPLGNDPETRKKRTHRLKVVGVSILMILFICQLMFLKGEISDAATMGVLVAFGNRLLVK